MFAFDHEPNIRLVTGLRWSCSGPTLSHQLRRTLGEWPAANPGGAKLIGVPGAVTIWCPICRLRMVTMPGTPINFDLGDTIVNGFARQPRHTLG
jgi:hypothetical protein